MKLTDVEIDQIRAMHNQGHKPGNIDTEGLLDTIVDLKSSQDALIAGAVIQELKELKIPHQQTQTWDYETRSYKCWDYCRACKAESRIRELKHPDAARLALPTIKEMSGSIDFGERVYVDDQQNNAHESAARLALEEREKGKPMMFEQPKNNLELVETLWTSIGPWKPSADWKEHAVKVVNSYVAEREAKLIADALRAAAETKCEFCKAAAHGKEVIEDDARWKALPADKIGAQWNHTVIDKYGSHNRGLCAASDILSLIPAQAEERDRRVVAEARLDEFKDTVIALASPDIDSKAYIKMRSAELRAAVQEKPLQKENT